MRLAEAMGLFRAGALTALLAIIAVPAASAPTMVNVPHFGQIALHGGGHVVVKHGAEQRVTLLKGSIEYTRFSVGNGDHLFIYACNERCPERYDLDIEIVTPVLNSASIGGPSMTTTAAPKARIAAIFCGAVADPT